MPTKPSSCIHRIFGYELYEEDGKPVVWHSWTIKEKQSDGVKIPVRKIERLAIDGDFGRNLQAIQAKNDLTAAWKEWVEWSTLMKAK